MNSGNSLKQYVFIIDDDPSVRKGLERIFKASGFSSKSFESADSFLKSKVPGTPGCIVLDVQMPGTTGPQLQTSLKNRGILTPIIFLSAHGSVRITAETMKKGAIDFLTKPVDSDELITKVNNAFKIDLAQREKALELERITEKLNSLTQREYQVMTYVISGLLNKQIAAELEISEETIKIHRRKIMKKMGIVSVAELVRLCETASIKPANPTNPLFKRSEY